MTHFDLVYNEIYKGCLKAGCSEHSSKDAAQMGLQKYKNHQFTKATRLITESITEAKKLIVKKRKK